MTDPVLELVGVSKGFDRGRDHISVLHDITLTVGAGDIVAVVADRDQGKTTLIRVASGMLQPDAGRVVIAGREVTAFSDKDLAGVLASDVGVATRAGPDTRLTVWDYVELSLHAVAATKRTRRHFRLVRPLSWKRERRERQLRVNDLLKRLDIADCAGMKWPELSNWQRVLVELAQALVVRPRLLLIDDLMDGHALGKKHAVVELLQEFADEIGCGVLMAVSDHAAALGASDVWRLRNGKLKLMHSDELAERRAHDEPWSASTG